MKVKYIQKCQCGAVTVIFFDGVENSMSQETYHKLKPRFDLSDAETLGGFHQCNHCVNHWGIDLCKCGSGEPVGQCLCGSPQAHSALGVQFDSFAAILENFRKAY